MLKRIVLTSFATLLLVPYTLWAFLEELRGKNLQRRVTREIMIAYDYTRQGGNKE